MMPENISSPEQLNDYMRVMSPRVWILLAAVTVLMAGIFVWSCAAGLETTVRAKAVVKDKRAEVVMLDPGEISADMPLRIGSEEYTITSTGRDDHGRTAGYAEVELKDGEYDALVITESIHPVEFLTNSSG